MATDFEKIALRATNSVLERQGILEQELVVLRDAGNTLIHIPEIQSVVRVATRMAVMRPNKGIAWLKNELALSKLLTEKGMLVLKSSKNIPPVVYEYENIALTFWEY